MTIKFQVFLYALIFFSMIFKLVYLLYFYLCPDLVHLYTSHLVFYSRFYLILLDYPYLPIFTVEIDDIGMIVMVLILLFEVLY
jgi:hypothetical protein